MRNQATPDVSAPLSSCPPQSRRTSRRLLPLVAGLAIGFMTTANAGIFSLGPLTLPTFVSSRAAAPFTSLVYVDKTSAPEWVLFSGTIDVASEIILPVAGSPTPTIKGAVLTYTTGITGIGVTSGLRYQLLGISAAKSVSQLPGALVFNSQMAVILPSQIRAQTFLVTVPVQMVVTFDAKGKIVEAAAPPTGLMGWWQADGTATDTLGYSPSKPSPLSSYETIGFAPGRIGQSFQFNGTGYIEAATPAAFETPTVTVATWVRANGTPGNFQYLVSKGAEACEGASYALFTGANGGLQFYVSDGPTFSLSPDAGTGIWDGNWHLVTGSFDGATVRLYVDGVEVGGGTPSTLTLNYSLSTSDKLYIGAYQGTCGLRFTGEVDDVQVFGRALAGIEVLGLYNAQH